MTLNLSAVCSDGDTEPLKPALAEFPFFRAASAPENGWPTLALEPAASGAWNADNSLVCSELRRKLRVIAGKIKKFLTVINRYQP
jgi:hypothetical protein